MPTPVKCPNCSHSFDIEEVFSADLEQKFQKEYQTKLNTSLRTLENEKNELIEERRSFEEKKKKENDLFAQKVQQELQKIESDLKKKIAADTETKIKFLEEKSANAELKAQRLEEKELEALRLKNELEELKRNSTTEKEKYLLENSSKIINEALAKQQERFEMEKKSWDVKADQQKKLIEEMERKMNQGSMQLQGEVQELRLEEMLREFFPFDEVIEISKGSEGADCLLIIKDRSGNECGKIIFESKRAKNWQNNWIDKLKNDMRAKQAELAMLVSQVFPRGMDCFGEREGVWIASFKEFIHLTTALRNAVIRIAETKKSDENKGEKMQMLYQYLTGTEFRQHIEAVVEGFIAMKHSITKERVQMEKIWKEREKQLDKVLLNTSGLYGSIKGIAGASVQDIPLLEGSNGEEET